jgi:hypothetical protein
MSKKKPTPEEMQKWRYRHIQGDLLDLWEKGWTVAIPTNGSVNAKGLAVMGRGLAKLFADHIKSLWNKSLRARLGKRLRLYGNVVQVFPDLGVITIPVNTSGTKTQISI